MTDASRRRFLELSVVALPVAAAAARGSAAEGEVPFPKIRRRVLGRTGLSVTELGAGREAVSDVAVLQRAAVTGPIEGRRRAGGPGRRE